MFASLFSSATQTDRRGAARKRVDGTGQLLACPTDSHTPALPVEVRDVSATGVGIMHDNPLPVGQKFVVKQESLAEDRPRLYTVVRSDTTPEGRYNIGLHASNLLDPHAEVRVPRRGQKSHAGLALMASIVFLIALAALMLY